MSRVITRLRTLSLSASLFAIWLVVPMEGCDRLFGFGLFLRLAMTLIMAFVTLLLSEKVSQSLRTSHFDTSEESTAYRRPLLATQHDLLPNLCL